MRRWVRGWVGKSVCDRMWERMCERMGKKGCEGKRKTTVYSVRSFRQTAENDVKHPKLRRKNVSMHVGILHEDGQTGITVWE